MKMLTGAAFFRTFEKGCLILFKASLHDISKAIEAENLNECHQKEIVSKQNHEFHLLFSNISAHRVPTHQPGSDHEVSLKQVEQPTWGPLYEMSILELVVLIKWLEENMSKGFIRQ
jgi:hypothetical protein